MKASVVIATYNGERFLLEQLESISNQTVAPFEVLVSDDGSIDQTLNIVRAWANDQPFPVRVMRNPNARGYNSNFSYAFGESKGDLIFPCDQDDVWDVNKIEVMISKASANADVMVFICDAGLSMGDGTPTGLSRIGQVRSARFSLDNYVQGACSAIRREFIGAILPVPASWAYDSWVHEIARRLGVRMVIPEVLQKFRRHADNATASPTSSVRPVSCLSRVRQGVLRSSIRPRMDVVKEQVAMNAQLRERLSNLRAAGTCRNLGIPDRAITDAYDISLAEASILSLRIAYLHQPRIMRIYGAVRAAVRPRRLGSSTFSQIVKDVAFK